MATSLSGSLYGKGNVAELGVGVAVDGSDVGVAAGATDTDEPLAIRSSNANNVERNFCNTKL